MKSHLEKKVFVYTKEAERKKGLVRFVVLFRFDVLEKCSSRGACGSADYDRSINRDLSQFGGLLHRIGYDSRNIV